MKILLVNKFHFLKGGSEQVYFATKDLLEKRGHEVICFSMQHEQNVPSLQDDFFVRTVDFSRRQNWWSKAKRFIYFREAAQNLARLLDKERPDLAHLHNISHQLTPAILAPLKQRGLPVVQTLHDYQLICPNYRLFTAGAACERCRRHRYYQAIRYRCLQNSVSASALAAWELTLQWWLKFYQEKVDLFISPSQFLANKLKEWGVSRPRRVVNNFIEVDKFTPEFAAGDYLISVGRLSEEKGILLLLQAMKNLPQIKLKLVGAGPQKLIIEKFLQEYQLTNVEYLGAIHGERLHELIRRARLFVIPSLWYENYPLAVLEAMALGKPVLAANIGGLPEIVREGESGWLFTAGDVDSLQNKIALAFSAPNIEQLGKQARRQIEQNNCSEKYYQELWASYEMACQQCRLNLG